MIVPTRFAALSAPDQWLIRQLQECAFGRVTFYIRSGSAHPASGFRLAKTRKLLGGESVARPQITREDFALRDEHIALLKHIASLPDGTCVTIKVVHGLPTTSIDIEEEHQAA